MTAAAESFKYDVAFSFLARDESLATRLNDGIEGRLTTFLYSNRQNELAGTDGEESFANVFSAEARVVVILYRDAWGSKGWTQIEQNAIRGRAYEDGYDFTLFIALDKIESLPAWLPKQRLYYGIERFGEAGALAVIETRVQAAGGQTREETFEECAARMNRNVALERERKNFLTSNSGVSAAQTEVLNLYEAISSRAIVAKSAGFKVEEKHGNSWATSCCGDCSISVDWQLPYANSLDESQLELALWRGAPPHAGDVFQSQESRRLGRRVFHFDLDHGEHGWRENGKPGFLSTDQTAETCIKYLLEKVHKDARES